MALLRQVKATPEDETLRLVLICRSSSSAAVACTRLMAVASWPISSALWMSTAASRGGPDSASSLSATRTSSTVFSTRSTTLAG